MIILNWLFSWITGNLAGALTRAYEARLAAESDQQRLVAEAVIEDIKRQISDNRNRADVIRSGMGHAVFWIPWLIAAVPTSAWFGWGMLDSLCNGDLPDVASLPPQLKEYADGVFQNIFYTGAGAAGVQAIATAVRGRR